MPNWTLRLAIADAVLSGLPVTEIQEKLWRNDQDEVRRHHDEIVVARLDLDPVSIRRSKEAPTGEVLTRDRVGLTINEISSQIGIARATLVPLLEHHGFLELVPYGGTQRRHLVTKEAFAAELGHNVNPVNRIGRLEGIGRAAVFPVFYQDRLDDVLWCLEYQSIKDEVTVQPTKRCRLRWLLDHHHYLPDQEVADLAGCSRRGVIKARQNRQPDRLAA